MRLGLPERIAIEAGIYRRASLPKSQKKSEQLQDLFQKRFGITEPCHLQLSVTAKIVDLLQNARDNVFAEIISADVSAYFAGR